MREAIEVSRPSSGRKQGMITLTNGPSSAVPAVPAWQPRRSNRCVAVPCTVSGASPASVNRVASSRTHCWCCAGATAAPDRYGLARSTSRSCRTGAGSFVSSPSRWRNCSCRPARKKDCPSPWWWIGARRPSTPRAHRCSYSRVAAINSCSLRPIPARASASAAVGGTDGAAPSSSGVCTSRRAGWVPPVAARASASSTTGDLVRNPSAARASGCSARRHNCQAVR